MTLISYAQNAEDVMLYRALKHVSQGFYIDIGANHPVEDSVTKAFYDRGWTGVNVEPVTYWIEQLKTARPRDRNLQIAISDSNQTLEFYEIVASGLSTLDETRAETLKEQGLCVQKQQIDTWTLQHLLESLDQPEIHFLKIDVEGAEAQVIFSGHWTKFRPWIVVVEATHPNTNESDHQAWESVLIDHAYDFVWFDGINRFYLAREHQELAHAFHYPVNVLDDYVTYREANLTEARYHLLLDLEALNKDYASAKYAHDQAVGMLNDPFVRFAIRLRKLPGYIKRHAKRLAQQGFDKTLQMTNKNPAIKRGLVRLLNRYPSLASCLRKISGSGLDAVDKPAPLLSETLAKQPDDVKRVLDQITPRNR